MYNSEFCRSLERTRSIYLRAAKRLYHIWPHGSKERRSWRLMIDARFNLESNILVSSSPSLINNSAAVPVTRRNVPRIRSTTSQYKRPSVFQFRVGKLEAVTLSHTHSFEKHTFFLRRAGPLLRQFPYTNPLR